MCTASASLDKKVRCHYTQISLCPSMMAYSERSVVDAVGTEAEESLKLAK